MNVHEPWEMLSDKKIWGLLEDTGENLDDDFIRLFLIELFSRIKNLERENYVLKVILFETKVVDENTFNETYKVTKDFLKIRDKEKADEVERFAKMGIPFTDWVNFITKGKFSQ